MLDQIKSVLSRSGDVVLLDMVGVFALGVILAVALHIPAVL